MCASVGGLNDESRTRSRSTGRVGLRRRGSGIVAALGLGVEVGREQMMRKTSWDSWNVERAFVKKSRRKAREAGEVRGVVIVGGSIIVRYCGLKLFFLFEMISPCHV